MLYASQKLLADLTAKTKDNLAIAESLKNLPENLTKQRSAPTAWNALECVAHLNRYGYFYLPEIQSRLKAAKKAINPQQYKSGWLGNYFANSMLPGAKGMKTFKEMNTLGANCTVDKLDIFISQQNQILALLKDCENYDLGKVKTSISISKIIKLRLADTLRVVIYHNQRHLEQAQRASLFLKTS